MSEIYDDLLAMMAKVEKLPPPIHRIRASHAVPYHKIYRQWNTKGQLEIWCNRGAIHDLPRKRPTHPAVIADGLSSVPVNLE